MNNENKIKNKKIKWLWIIAGVIILIIIIAIASSGEKKETELETTSPFQEKVQKQSEKSSTKPEMAWHNVISFSGTNEVNKNTQSFLIKGNQWRIKWNFQDSGEFGDETNGLLVIQVHPVDGSGMTEIISHSGLSASDISYIYEGKGEFISV